MKEIPIMSHKAKTKTILIYGLNPEQRLTLSMLCNQAGITCRILTDGETTMPISALLSGKELPKTGAYPIPGKFALLDGFDGQERMAAGLINQVAPGVIKAAHTKTHDRWRFCDLCSAILLEHKTMSGM